MSFPPRPNPPGQRPYAAKSHAVAKKDDDAPAPAPNLWDTARSQGYHTPDHGMSGSTVPLGAMKNGRYVKFTDGKTPETLAAEGQSAADQHAARVAEARKQGVLNAHFDDGGNLVGGVNLHTGELMTANADGQLVGDGHNNPDRVKELLAQEAKAKPATPAAANADDPDADWKAAFPNAPQSAATAPAAPVSIATGAGVAPTGLPHDVAVLRDKDQRASDQHATAASVSQPNTPPGLSAVTRSYADAEHGNFNTAQAHADMKAGKITADQYGAVMDAASADANRQPGVSDASRAMMSGSVSPAQQQQLSSQAQASSSDAYYRQHPGEAQARAAGSYGKTRQIADNPYPAINPNLQGTTALPNGGFATVGGTDWEGKNAPADGGTGLVRNGISLVKDANGLLVPNTFGPPTAAPTARDVASSAGVSSSTASPTAAQSTGLKVPSLDPATQKLIVNQYPEVGNAGSWANRAFINNLHPGANTPEDAQKTLAYLSAPPTVPTAAPAIATTPTLPDPSGKFPTGPLTRPNNNLETFPAGTAEAQTPDAPKITLGSGAAPAPQGPAKLTDGLSASYTPRMPDSTVSGSTIAATTSKNPATGDIAVPEAKATPISLVAGAMSGGANSGDTPPVTTPAQPTTPESNPSQPLVLGPSPGSTNKDWPTFERPQNDANSTSPSTSTAGTDATPSGTPTPTAGNAVYQPKTQPTGNAVYQPTEQPTGNAQYKANPDVPGNAVNKPTEQPMGNAVYQPTTQPRGNAQYDATANAQGNAVYKPNLAVPDFSGTNDPGFSSTVRSLMTAAGQGSSTTTSAGDALTKAPGFGASDGTYSAAKLPTMPTPGTPKPASTGGTDFAAAASPSLAQAMDPAKTAGAGASSPYGSTAPTMPQIPQPDDDEQKKKLAGTMAA